MAEGIAFDLVTGVLGKLGSTLWDKIGMLRSFKDDMDDLRSYFSAIRAVLLDAEERSSAGKQSPALRDWLRKLKDAAYDADDLLDEIRTQATLWQQQYPEVKVRGFLSLANPMHLKFKFKMAHRMKVLREKIGRIAKQRNEFGLAEAGPVRQAEFKRPETTSVVNEETIVGRDGDKEKIGMPRGIGKLVGLQELSVFVIGKQDRVERCASISELEHLKLVGELWIKGLENVTSPVDAKAANLIEKNLRSLKLEWNVLSAEEGMDSTVLPAEEIETVLENLQPHQKLENLEIEGFGGRKFPSWMMNRIGSCLPNLVKSNLRICPDAAHFRSWGNFLFLNN
uniref:Uncharacterized protein n=1 Tax=Ananas comosus var. bracteatus TaxID=296719 RepID=A0A6V7QE28_ANACO|nr:unnamed protein product [Ananas comosus var. bracteatus]